MSRTTTQQSLSRRLRQQSTMTMGMRGQDPSAIRSAMVRRPGLNHQLLPMAGGPAVISITPRRETTRTSRRTSGPDLSACSIAGDVTKSVRMARGFCSAQTLPPCTWWDTVQENRSLVVDFVQASLLNSLWLPCRSGPLLLGGF